MKRSITAFIVLSATTVHLFGQIGVEPVRIEPAIQPAIQAPTYEPPAYQPPAIQAPTIQAPAAPAYQAPVPAYQAPAPAYQAPAPAYQAPAPAYQAPYQAAPAYRSSEAATTENAKLRAAASAQAYLYQRVILRSTTSVISSNSANYYSARARFSVQGTEVAIWIVSNVREAVAVFVHYIRSIFSREGSSIDFSLEQIIRGARQDLHRRGFSDRDITLTYINQFGQARVVQISHHQFSVMIASR